MENARHKIIRAATAATLVTETRYPDIDRQQLVDITRDYLRSFISSLIVIDDEMNLRTIETAIAPTENQDKRS